MFKRANRGALPAMLVLGVLIGASLAVASPSRPNRVLPSASPPVATAPEGPGVDVGATGSGGAAEPHACAQAIAALAHGDHGLSHAIARVLSKCKENPQAPGLVNALLHRPGSAGARGPSHSGGSGEPTGGASTGSGGSGGTGSEGSGGSEPGTGGGGSGSRTGDSGSGSGGTGSGGDGKDNNGKAKGHFDGKGKNG